MLGSTLLRSPTSSSGVLAGSSVAGGNRHAWKRSIVVRSERNYQSIPKVKVPLGRPTLLEQTRDLLPFVDQIKDKLSDYCTTVDGDECCSCWDAYFEMQDLEKKWPPEKFDRFLHDVSHKGMKWLICRVHHAALLEKESGEVIQEKTKELGKRDAEAPKHVPDGIPKTLEEMEEEDQARMPASDFTRLLQSLRVYPSWYIARPDVEFN
ncbi:maternal effect embryo arrest 14 [Rhynchospora pubera]|uniref:Maternal effect embryo arrest 14 n=1 Tax=Rhynchospora pubera TaxID=906938 RepID=A0AAV8BQB3_9POAL|nr:maternal effect embryo arrest 14 [Rhynchospora pubera]